MRLFITVLSVFAILIAGALIAPSFVDWNKYKDQATTQIKNATGYDVVLNGDIKLSILPMPTVHINDVVVRAPAGGEQSVLASFKTVSASVETAPLLSKEIVVKSVALDTPVINLEVRKDGSQNWMSDVMQAKSQGKTGTEAAQNKAPSGDTTDSVQGNEKSIQNISLQDIEIKNGSFQFGDLSKGSLMSVQDINLDVSADTLQGPFKGDGRVKFNGQGIGLNFKTGALDNANKTVPLDLQVQAYNLIANVDGQARTAEPFTLNGNLHARSGSLESVLKSFGVSVELPMSSDAVDIKGQLSAGKDSITLGDMVANIGEYALAGDVKTTLADMKVNSNIKATNLPGQARVSGVVNANLKNGVTLSADITGSSADIVKTIDGLAGAGKGAALSKYKVAKFSNKINMKDGVLRVTDGTATLDGLKTQYAGTMRGQSLTIDRFTVEDYAGINATVSGDIKNVQTLDGLNLSVKAKVSDVKSSMGTFGMDAKSIPPAVKAADVSAKITGNKTAIDLDANVDVAGATVGARGRVSSPMSAPEIGALQMRVQGQNAARVIGNFASGVPYYASLARPMDVSFGFKQSGKSYQISGLKGSLAGASVAGNVNINTGASKPDVAGDLQFGTLTLKTDQASVAGGGAASASKPSSASKPKATSGKWSTDKINTAWMNGANIALDIKAETLVYETWSLASPKLKFALNNGALTIDNMSAGLYGGSMSMSGSIAQASGGGVSVNLAPKMNGIQIEPLVGSMAGKRIVKGQGEVNFNAALSGAGASQSAIINSLQGQGTVTGKSIVLEGMDLTRFARAMSDDIKPGDSLMNMWKGTTGGGSTQFDTLDGAFDMSRGVANITKLNLDGPNALLTTTGNVDLPKWWVKTAHEITIKGQDIPPFTMNIDGPLDNPGQTFAQGAINDYFKRKVSRKLEKLLQDKDVTDKINKALGDDLGGIVGGFLGGGTQKQQEPANDNTATPSSAPVPVQQKQKSAEEQLEDAAKDLLKGFF